MTRSGNGNRIGKNSYALQSETGRKTGKKVLKNFDGLYVFFYFTEKKLQ